MDLRGLSKKQMLKVRHDFQKKNMFPPRLNIPRLEIDDFEKLKKLSSSYPNTLINYLVTLEGMSFDE